MIATKQQNESRRGIALALVATGLVLAAAVAAVIDPFLGIALALASLAPLVLAGVAHAPWVAVGLYVIIAPWVMRATEIELGAGIPNLNFERLGIYGITAFVLLGILVGRRDRLPFTSFDRAWLMLIGAMIVSGVLMGRTPPQTFRQVINENIYPFLIYFGMKHVVTRPAQVRTIAISLMLAATLLGLHAFVDQVLGLGIGKVDRASITTNLQMDEIGGLHNLQVNRAGGPMGNSIVLGVSMIQGVVLGFFLLLTEKRLPARILAIAAVLLCSVGALVTYTRSVYFAFLLCAPLLWLWFPRLRKAMVVGGTLGVLGVAVAIPIAVSNPDNRILNIGSIFERFGMWVTSFYFIKASPLVGHGYGFDTYPFLKTQDLLPRLEFIGRRYYLSNTTPHNEFLRMTITMGVVGLALYCRFLWTMIGELNRFRKRLPQMGLEPMRPFVIAAACGMIGFYGQSLFTDMTAMNYADTVVFLFLGAVLGVRENALAGGGESPEDRPRGRVAREPTPDPMNEPGAPRTYPAATDPTIGRT